MLFAGADGLVGVWLLVLARRRAVRPQPTAITGLVLLVCAVVLIVIKLPRPGPSREPVPVPPRPAATPVTGAAASI